MTSDAFPEVPILDQAAIQTIRELGGEDDPDLLRDLVETYVADARERFEEMRRSLREGDVQCFERAAHTLKSSSANVGVMRVSELCRRLEALGREKSVEGAEDFIDAAIAAFEEAEAQLKGLVG